jgi:ubiquinone/menaquinone biosynthesis C-methylase UbiE
MTILTRSLINVQDHQGVAYFLNNSVMTTSDQKEFVANEVFEKQVANRQYDAILFEDIVFKSNFIRTFRAVMPKLDLQGQERILEMGAAHGWASVLVKHQYPEAYVVASDLVADALQYAKGYEQMLNAYLDEKWAFNCRDIPFENNQFDRIFTFAAFHHFGNNGSYAKSLKEMIRILKSNGKIVLLYEPSSPLYLYKFAYNRVNQRQEIDGVDEDVLVVSKLKHDVEKLGCQFHANFFPIYLYRDSVGSTLYYYLLSKIRLLQRILISSVNITITKP